MNWTDAHSHLADPRVIDPLDWLRLAEQKGATALMQAGVGPEDWQRQLQLAQKTPLIWPVFGVHPEWVASHTDEECESALDQLSRILPQAVALGETGLDYRPRILNASEARQIHLFESQLELARVAQKPVVLHLVRAFHESLPILDLFGSGLKGMVHAFAGSAPQAEAYLKRGLMISIGGALLRPDLTRLQQALQIIPIERLLLESDSPDQAPPDWPAEQNQPWVVLEVAAAVARIKQISLQEVLDKTSQNLRELVGR